MRRRSSRRLLPNSPNDRQKWLISGKNPDQKPGLKPSHETLEFPFEIKMIKRRFLFGRA
jgi:hypothetical protein